MVLKARQIWGPIKGPLMTSQEEVQAPPYSAFGQKRAFSTCVHCDYPYKWYDIIPEDLPKECGHPSTHGEGFYITFTNNQGIRTHAMLPIRCTDCDTRYRRWKRCNEAVNKLRDIADALKLVGCGQENRNMYKYLKLITFALPSVETTRASWEPEMDLLKSKMPKAIKILQSNGIMQGTWVPEVTSRESYCEMEWPNRIFYKHHAHVHAICVGPKVPEEHLNDFGKQLLPLGLGEFNYQGIDSKVKVNNNQVIDYVTKYLTKDGLRRHSFGFKRTKTKTCNSVTK